MSRIRRRWLRIRTAIPVARHPSRSWRWPPRPNPDEAVALAAALEFARRW